MTEQTPRVDEPTVQEILVRDPLTPVTRKERLYLLAVSMIGIAMVRTGLVPSKIATFGIELDKPNRHALLFLLALVTIYFLIAFVIYGVSDFMTRLAALAPAKEREISSLKYKVAAGESGFSVAFLKRELDRLSTQEFQEQHSRAAEIMFGPDDRFAASATISTRAISWPRIFFEFFLPILVGGYAIYTLLTGTAA